MFGKKLPQIGYEAYGEYVGWKNVAGLDMPTWQQLPARIQNAWSVAAEAIKAGKPVDRQNSRPHQIAYAISGGSIGWRWDDNGNVYYDISGLKVTPDEFKEVYEALRMAMYYV